MVNILQFKIFYNVIKFLCQNIGDMIIQLIYMITHLNYYKPKMVQYLLKNQMLIQYSQMLIMIQLQLY